MSFCYSIHSAYPLIFFCSFIDNADIGLQSLYESIKKEPFKIPEDDGNDLMHTFFNPVKEGWLWKQGTCYVMIVRSSL